MSPSASATVKSTSAAATPTVVVAVVVGRPLKVGAVFGAVTLVLNCANVFVTSEKTK